jgi:hypothetical protein
MNGISEGKNSEERAAFFGMKSLELFPNKRSANSFSNILHLVNCSSHVCASQTQRKTNNRSQTALSHVVTRGTLSFKEFTPPRAR